eukprot:3067000-Rhodomonas_salina.5
MLQSSARTRKKTTAKQQSCERKTRKTFNAVCVGNCVAYLGEHEEGSHVGDAFELIGASRSCIRAGLAKRGEGRWRCCIQDSPAPAYRRAPSGDSHPTPASMPHKAQHDSRLCQ